MSNQYINNDYTLNVYNTNKKDFGDAEVENIKYTTVTSYETSNWTTATASHQIISGTTDLNASMNLSYNSFGYGCVISGDYMVIGNQTASDYVSQAPLQGVFVFKSGSTGWLSSSAVIPAESDWPKFSSAQSGGRSQYEIEHAATSFDFEGNTIVICGPSDDEGTSGKTFVYESGSSGWAQNYIITTASVPSPAAYEAQNAGISFGRAARISGNRIVVGTFKTYADGAYKKHLFVYKSGSVAGWAYETKLDAGYENGDGTNTLGIGSYGFESNLHIDITTNGTRIIAAGLGDSTDDPHAPYPGELGSIVIWDYVDSAWVMDSNQIALNNISLNASVSEVTYGNNYDTEYKLYSQLGRYSCALSGNYIAAVAEGRNGLGSPTQRLPNRLFIFKSSSSGGWVKEGDFKSPNPYTEGANSATYSDNFGQGVVINQGVVAVKSPGYKEPWSSSPKQFGRAHIYISSSASGWALSQNIDNPYSGSADTSSGGYWNNTYRLIFGGPIVTWGTDFGKYSTYIGLSKNHMVIPWQNLIRDGHVAGASGVDSSHKISGGIYLIEGSGGVPVHTTTSTSTFTSTNIPFRFSANGVQNIRLQSGSVGYKTFIGDQRS